MKNKSKKNFWVKRTETFTDGKRAKSRASELRINGNTTDVTVDNVDGGYIVSYAVAKWYLEATSKLGIRL